MLSGGPVLVFLWSVCLLAAPNRTRRRDLCSLDRIKKVESLNNMLPTQMDLSLYTPSVDDYKKCPGATLSCFTDELSVLCEEMKASGLNRTQQNLSQSIWNLAKKFNESESDCRQCELHPEKSPEDFLSVLLNILEMINFGNC
ncbi:interleukin 15, like [Poeciliopsis prolifica]|uniref:interleukin 15, like n=1 Tax=Poeciliopsis prolifica TaxID=188132 RepID=UPI002412F687|nr:interleukin 15, like [Poeciliopsis prolifica]